MGGRSYARLDIEPFGEQLLASGDLDPVYIALHRLGLEPAVLHRWLLAYTCFYSAGFACYAAEREAVDFWSPLETAAHNEVLTPFGGRWPRGHERRHARGAQGVKMVLELRRRYGDRPQDFIDACKAPTCPEVMKKVATHYLFGRWIGFKIADLLDRVVGHPVSFDAAAVFMFDDPTKAANMLFIRKSFTDAEDPKVMAERLKRTHLTKEGLNKIVALLCEKFAKHLAPPLMDRPIGLQEVETILCKWKSHLNGHYPANNDIDEINAGLEPWLLYSNMACRFRGSMPSKESYP